jgi:hypothetical protein
VAQPLNDAIVKYYSDFRCRGVYPEIKKLMVKELNLHLEYVQFCASRMLLLQNNTIRTGCYKKLCSHYTSHEVMSPLLNWNSIAELCFGTLQWQTEKKPVLL